MDASKPESLTTNSFTRLKGQSSKTRPTDGRLHQYLLVKLNLRSHIVTDIGSFIFLFTQSPALNTCEQNSAHLSSSTFDRSNDRDTTKDSRYTSALPDRSQLLTAKPPLLPRSHAKQLRLPLLHSPSKMLSWRDHYSVQLDGNSLAESLKQTDCAGTFECRLKRIFSSAEVIVEPALKNKNRAC